MLIPVGVSSGLTTADANSLIDTAILANNATRAQTLRCRLRATSLAAFTASGSGVGKTLTKSSNGALGTVDSVTVVAGDRLFVDLGTANSGVYTATSVGAAGSPWVLTRTTDFDDANDVKSGTIVYVTEGTLYADTSWKLTTNDTITIDSTSQTWAAFTPNAYTDVTVGSVAIQGAGAAVVLTSTGSVISADELYSRQLAVAINSPTQFAANTNDLATAGDYGIIRISSDAARDLTGIVRPSGTYKNCFCKLINVGSYTITLVNDATSTAANRFYTGTGVDFPLLPNCAVELVYDLTSSRWRISGTWDSVHGADIASASTVNLSTATGNVVDVTGTTTITAITLAEGLERTVRFTGALTLTHGASLVLPGAASITTAAGDYAIFRGYASGVVRCVVYSKASGAAITASGLSDPQAIGSAKTGTWPDNSSYAYWSHKDVSATLTKYGVLQDSTGTTQINSASTKLIYFNIANSPAMSVGATVVQLSSGVYIYDYAARKMQSRPVCIIDNTVSEAGTTNVTVDTYATNYRVFLNNSGVSRTAYTVAHNSGTPEDGMMIEIVCNTTITTITFTSSSTVVNATFSCVTGDVIRYYYTPSAWFGTKSKAA